MPEGFSLGSAWQLMLVQARLGSAVAAWHRLAWWRVAMLGMAVAAGLGRSWHGGAVCGIAVYGSLGAFRCSVSRHGLAVMDNKNH